MKHSIIKISDPPYRFALVITREDGSENVYRFTNKSDMTRWLKETK